VTAITCVPSGLSHFRFCSDGPIHCPVCVLLRQMASEDGHLRRSRWNVPFEPLENEFVPYAKGAFGMLRTRADEQEISKSLFPNLGRSNADNKFKGISCSLVPAVAQSEQCTLIAHLGNKSLKKTIKHRILLCTGQSPCRTPSCQW